MELLGHVLSLLLLECLRSDTVRCSISFSVCPALVLESDISSSSPSSFEEWNLETKIWALSVLIAMGGVASGPHR